MTMIYSVARNAYPGDAGRIMRGAHVDAKGRRWDDGTEYQPLSSGVANTRKGAPTAQIVTIGSAKVTFVGRANARL